jgi:hypothetical protein
MLYNSSSEKSTYLRIRHGKLDLLIEGEIWVNAEVDLF